MPTAYSRFALIAVCSIITGSALAQDWPQWRGPNRDGQAAAFNTPAAWPDQLSRKWAVTVGEGDATPALVGDKLFVFARQDGREILRCLDAATGKELWTNPAIAVQYNSPVLIRGWIFGLSQGGALFCLNQKDGSTAWTAPAGDRGGFGSIVNAGDVLMLLTPKAELAVFPPSGDEYKPLASYKVADSATYAHPVVAGNRIYVKDLASVTLWTLN